MFRRNQAVFSTRTDFYGETGDGRLGMLVVASEPDDIGYDRNALTLLGPLAAVKTLVLSTSAAGYTEPTLAAFAFASEQMLKDPVGEIRALPDLPEVLAEAPAQEVPSASWEASLIRKKSGGYWVKGHGPLVGGPSYALWGTLALFDRIVQSRDRDNAILPAGVALRTLVLMARHHDGTWQAEGDAANNRFGGVLASVVARRLSRSS